MIFHFTALIRQSSFGRIIAIQVPDLKINFSGNALLTLEEVGANEFITKHIVAKLNDLLANGDSIPDPKKSYEFAHIKLGKYDYWQDIPPITMNIKKGCFERVLPKIGTVAAVSFNVANFVVMAVTAQLMLENFFNERSARAVGILGSANTCIIGLIIYFYSQSNQGLATIGKKLDRTISKKAPEQKSEAKPISCMSSTKLVMLKTCLSTILVVDTMGTSLSLYQQMDSVGEDARRGHLPLAGEFFDICKLLMVISGGITGFSFVTSFVLELYGDFEKRILKREKPQVLEDRVEIVVEDEKESSMMRGINSQQILSDEVEEIDLEVIPRKNSM